MRFAAIVLFATMAFFATASARADTGFVFSGFTCRQPLPCDISNPDFPSVQQLVSMANTCVNQNTGFSSPSGFFDEAAGLDASNCLTTKSDAFTSLGNIRSIPQCCVRQVGASGCFVQCSMVSQ